MPAISPELPFRAALLTDLYELTMMQGYFLNNVRIPSVFEMSFRAPPFGGGYTVFAGLETFLRAVAGIRFADEEIEFLAGVGLFRPSFLDHLRSFRFTGDIYAVNEGEIIFPNETIVRVHAEIAQAQFLESILLNIIGFQTLIATKAARIVHAAGGRAIMEFGLRRAQGPNGALAASRAAFIGGVGSTSNVLAGMAFGIPLEGTMAHSWVMAFPKAKEAFLRYANLYPETTVLLVDTYDTLRRGMPDAIEVFRSLKQKGVRHFGIRLENGDLEYLSTRARAMLDRAGLPEAKIIASNELNEYSIQQLADRKAPIDYFGVGANLVTAQGDSALTGIYNPVAFRKGNRYYPAVKTAGSHLKAVTPAAKDIVRFYDGEERPLADYICSENELPSVLKAAKNRAPFELFHPDYRYERTSLDEYAAARPLLRRVAAGGVITQKFPPLEEIRRFAGRNLDRLDGSYRRLLNPREYKVSFSRRLVDTKLHVLQQSRR